MRGQNPVLICSGRPTHHLERAEVGRQEAETRDPGCHFPPGEEKIFAGLGVSLEIEADAENGDEVQGYDRHVYAGERTQARRALNEDGWEQGDRKSTRLNSSHLGIS